MTIQRVALIFDDEARPETTGVYCLRALAELVEAQHFRPDQLDQIPREGFDLYVNVDDGLRYHLPPELRPCAWWAVDTHLNLEWCLQKASRFDCVFAAQRDGAELLRKAGVGTASWLPLACDPSVHRKHDVEKQYDVAFVGNVFHGPREDLLSQIRWKYPNSFIGRRFFDEMARTYSQAHMVFNRSIRNDVNMRVFEALACGSLLVTNDLTDNGQAELFEDGVHLSTYRELDELLDKLAFYLEREAIRERIASAGRAEVLARHTYAVRMRRLLGDVEGALARVVVRPNASASGSDSTHLQDSSYFGHARPGILALIPETARRVLDIGCGAGRLGEAVKARQPAAVTGIELSPAAAVLAGQRLDTVIAGDVEQLTLDFASRSFDAIVCGDILEHLREPERLLARARDWLAPDGCLIASIPNARHHSVVSSLLEGNWTYESAGLLDRTHLRFFTRREIEKLFFRAGFTVDGLWSTHLPADLNPGPAGAGSVQLGRVSLDQLSEQEAGEFRTYQYLIRARRSDDLSWGLTSIVIATHNQLACTWQCLDSIRRFTDEPYELVIVDNGSTDGTVDYLRRLPGVRLILNDSNRGFPAAVNQAISVARGSQVLLLNNDTLVTTGWLSRMLRALASDPTIGLVGPCSNFVSGPQQVAAGYDQIAGLDGFGWDWAKAHDGQRLEVTRLVGFCLLIKRAVIDAIGLLDEQFGLGCFEDDDYCLRAIQAGFRAVIAADAYIHHHGGQTMRASAVDFGRLMAENQQKFREKWFRGSAHANGSAKNGSSPAVANGDGSHENGHCLAAHRGNGSGDGESTAAAVVLPFPSIEQPDCESTPFAVDVAPGGGLRLQRAGRPRLSLCMIVRDSARTLRACLETIRPWVDEMVIVDTGSVDETPRIVEEYGGRLFHFPWCDDFSAARNESLRHALGDWLFWMDSDDTIPWNCGRTVRSLANRPVAPTVLGFVVQVHCPGGQEACDANLDVTAVDHVKLFRNRPDLRFDGRIHEQILGAIRRAGGQVAWSDAYVVHSGSDQSPAAQQRKLARDLHLLNLELAERPEHPFTLFNLGMTHVHASRFAEGADFLKRGIARSNPDDSHLRKAFALLVYAEMQLGHREAAAEICRRGRALFPRDAELMFREGVLCQSLGRFDEARRAYLEVLRTDEERHFASVDRGLAGFKAHHNLAVLAAERGDLAEAEREWREVLAAAPAYRQGWRGLGDTLGRQGRLADAEALAAVMRTHDAARIEAYLLESRVAVAAGRIADARTALDRAASESPADREVLQNRGQFFYNHGPPEEAEAALRALIAHDPTDACAHHNLGTLLLNAGRFDEAAVAYRQSLRFRCNGPATYLNLAAALSQSGRLEEAVGAWVQVLRLAPGEPTARRELIRAGRVDVLAGV